MGVLRGKVGLARVQQWFDFLYEIDLLQGGEGMVLPFLEASLSLHEGRVGLRLKVRVDLEDKPEKRIIRSPNPHSVNAKNTVKHIAVGLGLECVW